MSRFVPGREGKARGQSARERRSVMVCCGDTPGARARVCWGESRPYFVEKNKGEVVLVTANVRLGLLGFAALDSLRARDPTGRHAPPSSRSPPTQSQSWQPRLPREL